jgi:hypothetical protein
MKVKEAGVVPLGVAYRVHEGAVALGAGVRWRGLWVRASV